MTHESFAHTFDRPFKLLSLLLDQTRVKRLRSADGRASGVDEYRRMTILIDRIRGHDTVRTRCELCVV